MEHGYKSLYKDYEELLIKNGKLSEENRTLKYMQKLLESQNKTFKKQAQKLKDELQEKNNELKAKEYEIARLKALLNIDGTNHGIPTSQTPIHKKKVIPTTRQKTGLPKGGKKGHAKHKLEKFADDEVTEIKEHNMEKCPNCESEEIEPTGKIIQKDELDYKLVVDKKRHDYIEYRCKTCGKIFHEKIPTNLKEENQYGPQVQSLGLTLMNQGNVPMNKTSQIIYGMTNGEISPCNGYLAKLQKRAAKNLDKFMRELKQAIVKQGLLHWDDTVIMIDKKRSCLRFYGTKKLAFYTAHAHKDKNGLDEDGILAALPKETIVVHDHNRVNYNDEYVFQNAECNRHLISDLKKIIDNLQHNWAQELMDLLTSMDHKRNGLLAEKKEGFEQEELNEFENKFEKIMIKANQENEEAKGKYYADTEATLIVRILDFKNEYLLWLYDFDVPFTNNLSERGLRGVKSKQKSAGQFWSVESASWYATIRSYTETCHRNGVNEYNALLRLSLGMPYSLEEILNGKAF